jgi:putative chitinase
MGVSDLQAALAAAGYDPGAIDGDLGPRTYAALIGYTVQKPASALFTALAAGMGSACPTYRITTRLRIAHWLGQAAHETGRFQFLTEVGDAAYFARYDGRKDLGNTQPGDGAKYRGRGLFQITGRANYARYGAKLNLDLIDDPAQAADPGVAVRTACLFWDDHALNALADADDCKAVTQTINGGQNGYADRLAFTTRVKAVWPA